MNCKSNASNLICPNEKSQFNFAEKLFEEKEYEQAISEYQRFIFFYPNSERVQEAQFKIAVSYFKEKIFDKSISICYTLFAHTKKQDLPEVIYLLAMNYFMQRDYNVAINRFKSLVNHFPDSKYSDKSQFMIGLCYFLEKKEKKAKEELLNLVKKYSESNLVETSKELSVFIEDKIFMKQKSCKKAFYLSAVIPGSGQIYLGEKAIGINTFLTNSLLSFLIVDSVKKHYAGGTFLFSTLFFKFYQGNIRTSKDFCKLYINKNEEGYLLEVKNKIKSVVINEIPYLEIWYDKEY